MTEVQELTATAPDTATKAKPYVCLTCTRPFARLEHLKRHERSHTKEKPFCCDQAGTVPGCGRHFARRDLLLRHQQKIHLFPNTSKRRRLSSVSQVSSQASRKASPPMVERQAFTISIPNLDDLTNFENGTVNPSSIYSSSPPSSAHTNIPQFMDNSMHQQHSNSLPLEFSYATEKLFPRDIETVHTSNVAPLEIWPVPDLVKSGNSPTSTISSQYSPPITYNSLGRHASLESAGADSELFPQDFFVGGGAYLRQFSHHRSHSMPMSQNSSHMQSQLYLNSHLDNMDQKKLQKRSNYATEDLMNLQFAGGDMAYCNGFRPSDGAFNSLNYVETF